MDVRCERCRAQYTFQEDQVTPEGVTVQCSVCGHLFQVKRELAGTVAAEELPVVMAPAMAGVVPALRPAPPADPPRHWTIRQASGQTMSFSELTTLQRWIVERKVVREDQVTQGDGSWVGLGTLAELLPFFDVVEAADRAQGRTTSRYPPAPYPPPTFAPPQVPPPAWAPLPPGPAPTPAYGLPPPPPSRPTPYRGTEPPRATGPDREQADPRSAGRSSRSRTVLLALLLLVMAGAGAAYVFMPALFGRAPPPPTAAPLAVVAKPEPPPPEPKLEPKPEPEPKPEVKAAEPEPTPEPPAARAPEPTAETRPEARPEARPRPPTAKQLLAEARRLREANKSEQALTLYGRALAEAPENAEALAGRGLCYFDLDQYAPAEASLEAALRLSPRQPEALLGLAETYRAQGRKAEAIAQFERYLAAHPGGDEAAVARNAIHQLKE